MALRQIDGKGSNNADVVADILWAVIFDSVYQHVAFKLRKFARSREFDLSSSRWKKIANISISHFCHFFSISSRNFIKTIYLIAFHRHWTV